MPRIRRKRAVPSSDVEESPKTTPRKVAGGIEAAFARAGSRPLDFTASPKTKLDVNGTHSPVKSPLSRKRPVPASQINSPAGKGNGKTKSIHSFFNPATQKQHSGPNELDVDAVQPLCLEDDNIQDSSDESCTARKPSVGESGIRKRKLGKIEGSKLDAGASKFLKSSFSLSSSGRSPAPSADVGSESSQWTDDYAPVDFEELAVHKKKVQDVRDWLTKVFSGNERKRLLVLKGGAGTGKTTTIKLLAKQLKIDIAEWTNPESTRGPDGAGSYASQFDDFVRRTCSFGNLAFRQHGDAEQEAPQERLVLVEEFPNTYSTSSSTLQGFRRALLQYLATATPSADEFFAHKISKPKIVPIVVIISEALLTTPTASADSFTAHRLLGPDVLSHNGTSAFDFNPIAPTFMAKALDVVLKKDSRKTGRIIAPGTLILKHLSETGDIRSAVSALQFFCIYHGDDSEWSGKLVFTKGKKQGAAAEPTQMERRSLEMITQRENTLGIFHAVGKVVYNKREPPDNSLPQPPASMPHLSRPNKSEVDADSLLNELGTEMHIFIAALHENYALSCGALSEDETLDSITGCIDTLSDADLLAPQRFGSNRHRYASSSTATDALRQEDIGFYTAVFGLLFHLPYPVKRLSPPVDYITGRGKTYSKNAAFQMMYPASERLWRQREQIQDLLVMFRERFRDGELCTTSDGQKSMPKQGVESWRRGQDFSQLRKEDDKAPTPLVRSVGIDEFLLERLPYVAKLEKLRAAGFGQRNTALQQLQKIVSFHGVGNTMAPEDDEAAEEESNEQWNTDKPTDERQPWRKAVGVISKSKDGGVTVKTEMEKLVLSDDDIEDD